MRRRGPPGGAPDGAPEGALLPDEPAALCERTRMASRSNLRGLAVLVPALLLAAAGSGAPQDGPGAAQVAATMPAEEQASQAQKQLLRGMELYTAGKLVEARAELSGALLSWQLEGDQAAHALKALTELADKTLLSPTVCEGDPYAYTYTIRQGDLLNRVVKSEKVYVSPEFILKVNGLADARGLRAGQQIKMVRGPVHAVIYKQAFTMDLYLQRDEQPRAFLNRIRVGLGKANGTPEGLWRVSGKVAAAPWTAPPDHPLRGKVIRPGEPMYPLGKDGLWIALEGSDQNTQPRKGYGIHGTDEPSSIGRAESSGCVRLADEDIRLAFWLFCEKLSTVQIRP